MGQYLPLIVLLALAGLFAVLSFAASRLLNPPRPNAAKSAPYECGMVDLADPPERFPVRFYLVAMIFVVIDVEIVFLYPYSIVYEQLGAFGLLAVVIFAAAVFESFVYVISNGVLDWGPMKRVRHSAMKGPGRTATSTVRRVGLEGRDVESILANPTIDEPAPVLVGSAADASPGRGTAA